MVYWYFLQLLSQFNGKIIELILNIIPEAFGAFIGIGGALWIFEREQRLARQAEFEKDKKEVEATIMNLALLYKDAFNNCKVQIGHWKELISLIEKNPKSMPIITLTSTTNLLRINKIFDDPKTLVTYTEKFGLATEIIKEYRNISLSTDFLSQKFSELYDNWLQSRAGDLERRKKYFRKVEAFFKTAIDTTALMLSNHLNPLFTNYIKDILDQYQIIRTNNQFSDDIEIHFSNLITPIREGIMSQQPSFPGIMPVFEESLKLTGMYHSIIKYNQNDSKRFQDGIDSSNEAMEILTNPNSLNSYPLGHSLPAGIEAV